MGRDRTIRELERRYQEAVYNMRQEIRTPLQYEQMLTVIAHFMQFLVENRILSKIVEHLTNEKKYIKTDKAIGAEADTLIVLLKTHRDKLVKLAKRKMYRSRLILRVEYIKIQQLSY